MEIKDLRNEIDKIDDELAALYVKRLSLCEEIGQRKAEGGLPVNAADREMAILSRLTRNADEDRKLYIKQLYEQIFLQSKALQAAKNPIKTPACQALAKALQGERKSFPIGASVACQGINGAYSGIAAKRLFEIPDLTYFKSFEGVFNAVESGLCEYGVLPIENSTAGSVSSVYDLMKKHKFYIVKSIRQKISHCLLTKNSGAKIEKVYSHGQALSQCAEYIKLLGATPIEVENTATAAKMVAEGTEAGAAAIASEECAALYGLTVAEREIGDSDANYTRFICIRKDLTVFRGADKISVMTSLPHKVGSLNSLLSRFSSQGLNLTKLESRPIAGGDFAFLFYFDFVGDVESPGVLSLLSDLEATSDKFVFLGSYKEIL